MKYRVLRYFEGEESHTLIGHFDLKLQAGMAISDDQIRHPNAHDLKYLVEEVNEELTQEQIDVIIRERCK